MISKQLQILILGIVILGELIVQTECPHNCNF